MANIKLDFSQFKHVSTDDKTTTLEHKKDKHLITLHHNALSKSNVEALKALAPKKEDNKSTEDSKAEYGKIMDPKGQKPQVFAEGGQVAADPIVIPPQDSIGGQNQPVAPIENALKFDPSQPVSIPEEDVLRAQQSHGQNIDIPVEQLKAGIPGAITPEQFYDKPVTTSMPNNAGPMVPYTPQTPPSPQGLGGTAPTSEGLVPQTSPAQQPQGLAAQAPNPSDPTQGLVGGYNTQMAGIQQMAKAEGDLGKAQATVYEKQALDTKTALDTYQKQLSNIESDMKAHEADIKNGYIDPNKYWTGYTAPNGEKIAGHSKMAAAIGMILGGFNPSGGANGAEQLLKYQMEQSLDAQKQNLNSSQNLLKANLEHYKDVQSATQVTRAMLADAAIAQVQQAAAKAKSPMAQAAALQAIGPLQREKAQALATASAYQTLAGLSKGGIDANGKQDPTNTGAAEQAAIQLQRFNPELAKQYTERIVPGVGVASQPVPNDVRKEMIGKMQFNGMMNHYIDWVKKNSGSLNPAKVAEGKAMAAELSSAYRNAVNGGVYKESEQEFIDKIIPHDPSQFLASVRTLPKVEEVAKSMNNQLETLRKGYGMAGRPQAVVSRFQEGQIATNPKTGEKLIFQNGKWMSHK